ncbi:MAG: asparagine synthase (glutamine-hydrolyzing) [Bacilli bacterium]
MCGFVGYVNKDLDNTKVIKEMCNEIIHRGKDHSKYIDDNITLGFQRLSIVGESTGTQPMEDYTKRYVLIFNGEIYNFKELKNTLIKKGYKFNSESDSEVILNAYAEYKEKCVNKLRGMYAFVIYDKKENKIFGARDHFGIKPFYYYNDNNQFMFGSEIKSFLKHPNFIKEFNKDALRPYLIFQSNVLEETFFKNVFKLMPGHYLTFENNELSITKYYEYEFDRTITDEKQARELLEETINSSINIHTDTEKKLCTFLSSGIDSSLITSILKPDKAYSAGFSAMFNETEDAKKLCEILDVEFEGLTINDTDIFENLEKIVFHLDEPHSNPSLIPLYFLSKEASKDFDIVLTGEGADELLGGYYLYDLNLKFEKYDKLPKSLRNGLSKFFKTFSFLPKARFFIDGNKELEDRFIGQAKIFEESELDKFVTTPSSYTLKSILDPVYDKVKNENYITKMQYLDLNIWQPSDILLKADKMTMAHTLEGRVPYLDLEVFNIARKLDTKFLIRDGEVKKILRDIAKASLPEEWVKRKKMGFPVPVKDWLRSELGYTYAKELFNKKWIEEFFDIEYINALLDNHYNSKITEQRKIWTILIFAVWYNKFIA